MAKNKNLVVVESPAKARTVSRFLGKNYVVKASLGHVRDLPKKELGVEVDDGFRPHYAVLPEKRKVMAELKEAAKEASSIYLATDPDREGEAISWHLVHAAGWRQTPVQRVVFHEITQDAIQEAFRHPRTIDMHLVNAQQARRILDRLVGYQLSPLLWRKVQRGLSAGRVQSVALRLVVDREREITSFVPQEYWTIQAKLSKLDGNGKTEPATFTATLHSLKVRKGKLSITNEVDARQIVAALGGARYAVAQVTKKEVHTRPSPPFITSTLQQEAWRKLRFSAKKTMMIAQQLYEGLPIGQEGPTGLITYMRTDSTHMAPAAIREAQAYIKRKFGAEYAPPSPRVFTKKAKGAQEAHEAIRPTSVEREPDSLRPHLSSEQLKLYDLIWKRMLASQMSDAVSDSTVVDIDATPQEARPKIYVFRATGSVLRFPGFRTLYMEGRDDRQEDSDTTSPLPLLARLEELKCLGLEPSQHFTQPPQRYTEATLIKALEERGIGRPSTYAPIISTILDRGYVTKEQGHFKPQKLGETVCDLLSAHFPNIMDLNFTAQMEENLDEIARGEREWVPVLKEFYRPFQKTLEIAAEQMPKVKVEEPTDEVCDKCGRPMVIKTGRFGKFVACTGFPECRNTMSHHTPIGVDCPRCGGNLVERRGKKGVFYGCANYPTCDFAVNRRPLPTPCPECGGLLVSYGKDRGRCTQCSFKGNLPQEEPVEAAI